MESSSSLAVHPGVTPEPSLNDVIMDYDYMVTMEASITCG